MKLLAIPLSPQAGKRLVMCVAEKISCLHIVHMPRCKIFSAPCIWAKSAFFRGAFINLSYLLIVAEEPEARPRAPRFKAKQIENTPCFSKTSPYNARLAAMYMQRLVHRFLTPCIPDDMSF
jgi:hypothetical protein